MLKIKANKTIFKTATAFVLAMIIAFMPAVSRALPDGGQVVGGSASISTPNAATMQINQITDKAIINWNGFSINVNELVKFIQPNSSAIALNRVIGADPSVILGQLSANGRIFLVNPNGILFGQGAKVDAAGLLATTLNIKDDDFMAGRYIFNQDTSKLSSYVINKGEIKIADNGFVFLAAPAVSNEGLIIANLGKVVMGAGNKLTLDFFGDGLITYAVEGKVLDSVTGPDGQPLTSAVSNTGTIKADGGQVLLTADASNQLLGSVINQSGIIEAKSLVNKNGEIILSGGGEGVVANYGKLDVSAAEAGAKGGNIAVTGEYVGHAGIILADGSDNANAGNVYLNSTKYTLLTSGSLISASGKGINSNGGDIRVLSDVQNGKTVVRNDAKIIAKGGDISGDGGFIEVSGHDVSLRGEVDLSATNGRVGTFLLDPDNIIIAGGSGGANDNELDDNQILFDDGAGDFTISEQKIETTDADIILQAKNSITVSGTFNNNAAGEGDGVLLLMNDRNLTLETRNAAGEGTGGIDLRGSSHGNSFEIRTQGTGGININSATDGGAGDTPVNLTKLTTDGGDVSITTNGDITLYNNINAGTGLVNIESYNGAIIDGNGNANNITADRLAMKAWTGIGSADALETQVSNLNAYTNSGDIKIANTGDLAIDDFSFISANGYGVENEGGNVSITNTGSINIPGTNGDGVYATGDIMLTASGANSDITAIGITAAESNGGSITFDAGRDISLDNARIYVNNGNGAMTLTAGRDITVDNSSYLYNYTGNIALTAGNNISISNWSTIESSNDGMGSFGSISLTATSGNVSISDSYMYTDGGGIDIQAAGDITLQNNEEIYTYWNFDSTGSFTATAGGNITIDNSYIETYDGNIVLTSTAGNVLIDNSSTLYSSGLGNVEIQAHADITLGSNVYVETNAGNVELNAGGAVAGAADSLITAPHLSVTGNSGIGTSGTPLNTNVGTLTASSTNSDIYINENDDVAINTINAGTGNVTLTVGGSITDNNGAANNVTASTANLTAGIVIGDPADPIEVTANTINASPSPYYITHMSSQSAPSTGNVLSDTLTDNGFTNSDYERAANADQRPAMNEFGMHSDVLTGSISDSFLNEDLSSSGNETGKKR